MKDSETDQKDDICIQLFGEHISEYRLKLSTVPKLVDQHKVADAQY